MIDWHNYGYTILAVNKGKYHWSVFVYRFLERLFGRGAYANLCVSEAMKEDLADNWDIHAEVLYDKPPSYFKPATINQQHKVFIECIVYC